MSDIFSLIIFYLVIIILSKSKCPYKNYHNKKYEFRIIYFVLILIYWVKINFDGASLEYKLTTTSSKVEIVLYLNFFLLKL